MATRELERPSQRGEVVASTPEERGLVAFNSQLVDRADEFRKVLPSHITPEKFQRTVITAVTQNPDLLNCDRRSLITACMKAAQDALLPDGREAALVKFNTRQKIDGEWKTVSLVQYMPMVYGLRKKILQSGEVSDIKPNVVYRREVDEGRFVYEEGSEAMLRHKPILDLSAEEAADDQIVAAYSMATYKDGSKSYEVMRRFEIDKVRECSQTGATRDRKGDARDPSGPWVDWFPEQSKKTVMRRHSKTLPMSGDILDVEAHDDYLAARSVTHVLSTPGGEPREIEAEEPEQLIDQSDRVFDPSDGSVVHRQTGEVLDDRTDGPEHDVSGDDDDWPAWLETFEHDVNHQCGSAVDVNSYWSSVKKTLEGAPDHVQERAADIKNARLSALKTKKGN